MPASEWLIHQLSDSAFPAGGFAHSGGLEAVWHAGRLPAGDSLDECVRWQLHQAAHLAGPFVCAAHRQPDAVANWDSRCENLLNNHVANRASRAQGQAFLLAGSRIFAGTAMSQLAVRLREQRSPCHFAPILGASCQLLDVDVPAAVRLFLFLTLRSLISASVRLGIAGPMEGQTLQWKLSAYAESLVKPILQMEWEDAAQTAPLLDLMQGTHDRLYSRLFQS